MLVYRWGQSAYETKEALDLERHGLEALGYTVLQNSAQHIPRETNILVTTSKKIVDASMMAALPNLKLILTTTSGYEHIDIEAAKETSIMVGRCPIARRDAVVDTSIAMALSLLRELPSLHDQARMDIWARNTLPQRSMSRIRNLNVGIIGYGIIGKAAARMWLAMGAKVRWHDPAMMGSFPLEDLLGISEVCSLHCAHTPSSHNIINEKTLSYLPKGSIVVNTARGKCVNVKALFSASNIGGIGLDVFPQEPPSQLSLLAQHPNTILLPHAAGYHKALGKELAQEVVDALCQFKESNTLPHPVES